LSIAVLTQIEAAALLSIAPRTLRDWHDAPRNPDGSYSGPALVAAYLLKQTGSDLDLNKERARLAKEQADRTGLQNAIARGDVIPSSQATAQWSAHVVAARAKLLALPTKLGPQLIALTDVNTIAETIRSAVYESLDELARWTPGESSLPVDEPAEVDGEPVGGQGAPVKPGKQRRARAVED
jgi:hypothetical protein